MTLVFSTAALILALAASPLKSAERAYQELEFDKAEKLYLQALTEPATREERIATYRGLGLARAFMGQTSEARGSFEKLLLLNPEAKIDSSMGPKIGKPFEAARKALGARKNALTVERSPDGSVSARLVEQVPLSKEYSLSARPAGAVEFVSVTVGADQPIKMAFEPTQALEVYAESRDAHQGVLYSRGSATSPLQLNALRAVLAVDAAVTQANREHQRRGTAPAAAVEEEGEPGVSVPLVVGIGAVVTAGVLAGVLIANRPPPLSLPPADRTGQLP